MRKFNAENERVKRDYIDYLRHADGKSEATVDKIAAALIRFEESTGFKPFKNFHIEQAKTFKRNLERSRNPASGEFWLLDELSGWVWCFWVVGLLLNPVGRAFPVDVTGGGQGRAL